MLIICPHCETRSDVAAEALGESGCMVRCARCRGSWFAAAETTAAEPETTEADTDGAYISRSIRLDDSAAWVERPAIDIESKPSCAIDHTFEIAVEPLNEPIQCDINSERRLRLARNLNRSRPHQVPKFVVIVIGMLGLAVTALVSRATIVQIVPDLAGVYVAFGIPVNLRGLEFRNVKTTREMQDGIPVLAIEGEVVNVVSHAVEVPRLRLAVLGPNEQELYSWTTVLQRSILADNERVSFRSRLASPPPEGREVLVRFLTRSDLTATVR